MTPPMAVRLAADLRPSTDGSAVRTSLVAGGGPAYILGWDRQTDGSRYRLLPHTAGGHNNAILPASSGERLCDGTVSVCLSACLSRRSTAAARAQRLQSTAIGQR